MIPESGRSTREGIRYPLLYSWAFLVAQLVKNLPAMQETWVQPLGWEGPLEKEMATHSSILAWRIPWTVCFARCPNPRAGREKASKTIQLAKKEKFITDSSQGSCRASNTVVRGQRALSRGGYPNL